jgi:hypothetical protein
MMSLSNGGFFIDADVGNSVGNCKSKKKKGFSKNPESLAITW